MLFYFGLYAQHFSRILIPDGMKKISQLAALGIPVDDAFARKDGLIIELNDNELHLLQEHQIHYQVLIKDVKAYYKKRIASVSEVKYPKDTPEHFHLGSMGGNLTYEELLAELDSMHNLYPNLISEKTPISTDTITWEGREIYYVKLTANVNQPNNRPEVLYTGLHHAREPVSMMQLVYLMWWLLENYGIDDEATYFLDNFNIYFVPCVNPDGYVYNETTDPDGGGMWRKNRRDNGDGTYGVDLNRNYTFNWGYDDNGSSPDPSSDTYRGPSPASEPETKLMISFIERHNFKLILNHHTYSNLLIYPYGYDEVYPEDYDVFRTYATIMTRVNHFAIGTPWELLYPVNGDANDWAYGTHQILAMTPETGGYQDGFWPSSDRIIPLCENNMEMNKFLIRLTGKYAEAQDAGDAQIPIFGYEKIKLQCLGQDTNATFKVYLTGDKVLYSDTLTFSDMSLLEIRADSLFYLLDTNLTANDTLSFDIAVDNGLITYKFPAHKKIEKIQTIFYDPCDNMNNWISNQWNITTDDFHSAPSSITDSPDGNYQNNTSNTITSESIDISGYNNLFLSFWAKWDIENDYDYNYIQISPDGTNWHYIETQYAQDNGHGTAYTGSHDWVNDYADISQYASSNFKIRFTLNSDQSITGDGFYFDDLKIFARRENTPPQITGQNQISFNGDRYTITPNDIQINDPDNDNKFFVFVYPGEGYHVENFNTIVLDNGYKGILHVPVKVHDGYDFSNFYTLTVNASTNVEISKNLTIYPNPVKNFIVISADKNIRNVEIYTQNGRKLMSYPINKLYTKINFASYPSGVYFLKIITDDGVRSAKIIKINN